MTLLLQTAIAALLVTGSSSAQTGSAATACPTILSPSYKPPVVGAGWTAQLVVTGLVAPRGIIFDNNGALLVVEQGKGVTHINFTDHGGTCLDVAQKQDLITDSDLNHGIEISADGRTLYASSSEYVYAWQYDGVGGTAAPNPQVLVQNMSNTDHTTRTLLLSQKEPGTLLVSRGSAENMDMAAQQLGSGHSQIRAFNIADPPGGQQQPYDFPSQGRLLGWGLRNSVGVAEEPVTGGIYSVENSADQVTRDGQDVHTNDPGEEMNFHGFLNASTTGQGGNYGYPDCFALWGLDIPDPGNMTVGSQFALDPNSTLNDATCAADFIAPRLTFQAHMAPLDIIFTPDGSEAFVTFHGSWNRQPPVGYKLSTIAFADGEPVDPPDSTTSLADILSNADNDDCPGACFRPVGLAMDGQGRVFMSSDATGEIYVLQRSSASASSSGTASGTGTMVTPTASSSSTPNAGPRSARSRPGSEAMWLTVVAVVISLAGGTWAVFA